MDQFTNPYEAPQSDVSTSSSVNVKALGSRGIWVTLNVLFALNAIFPVFDGVLFSNHYARFGVVAGLILLYGIGTYVCFQKPRFRAWLIIGGKLVAATQVLPLLQLYIVFIGSHASSYLESHLVEEEILYNGTVLISQTFLTGFVKTMISGGMIMMLSLCIGWVYTYIKQLRRGA
ncbi:MAG: hypothetical protein SFX18_03675 [Pirellulales bacterium]|nr:hypothetical protein [Pirellulales bacterium]